MRRGLPFTLILLATACTTIAHAPDRPFGDPIRPPTSQLTAARLPEVEPVVVPEPKTLDGSWILDLYDWLRGQDYRSYRVEFPGADGRTGVAHLLLPNASGPHPAVIVFPIRGGSHLVSEALAKALVHRGYAALRLERRQVFQDADLPGDFSTPAARLRDTLRDARCLVDWLEAHPDIDDERLAAAGVSLGGILAATLMGVDERIRAGLFLMAGGGLAELLYDSQDSRVRRFREHALERTGNSREAFLEELQPYTQPIDPITYAGNIDPSRALLVSGRFDRVVPPDRTALLWEAMGRPTWIQFPAGHHQFVPFFWWSVGRGADLFDRVLTGPRSLQASAPPCDPDTC